jgi:topoisomerase IA-like protein
MKTDPRVDQYIAKAAPFAQAILNEVRKRIQKACPAAEETMKWNVPFYVLDGKMLASMAAFKKHTKIGVWVGMRPDMVDVSSLAELPSAKDYAQKLQAAAKENAGGAAAKKTTAKTAKKAAAKKAPSKKAPIKKAPIKKTARTAT